MRFDKSLSFLHVKHRTRPHTEELFFYRIFGHGLLNNAEYRPMTGIIDERTKRVSG